MRFTRVSSTQLRIANKVAVDRERTALGFGSQNLTLALSQIEKHEAEKDGAAHDRSWMATLRLTSADDEADDVEGQDLPEPQMEIHTYLWCASNKRGEQGLFRFQCHVNHIRAGRAWVSFDELVERLAGVYKSDTIRRLIRRGNGTRWTHVPGQGRIYAYSCARIAAIFGLQRTEVIRPVRIEVPIAGNGLAAFNTAVYGAWLAAMNGERARPLSRAVQCQLTGLSERVLRKYTADNPHIQREKNYTLVTGWGAASEKETAVWNGGTSTFYFIDRRGRQGVAGGEYLAREIASTYHITSCQLTSKNRARRLRRKLKDLANDEGLRNVEGQPEQRYFEHGYEAAAAVSKRAEVAYWRGLKGNSPLSEPYQFWRGY